MKPNYKKIYRFISKTYKKVPFFSTGVYDETYFSLLVYETAKDIIQNIKQKVKEEVVLTACLLHDIGKTKLDLTNKDKEDLWAIERKKHGSLSVPIARKFLKTEGFQDTFIDDVCFIIERHDHHHLTEKSIELQILQDADIIADSGYPGIARTLIYTGQYGRSIFGNMKFVMNTPSRVADYEFFNLQYSKKLAREKHKIEKTFFKEFCKPLKSELLK